MKLAPEDRYMVGEAAIQGMLDRGGISSELDAIKSDDPEIWDEILQEIGDLACEHLAERNRLK